MEIWVKIKDYDYEVSSKGYVKNYKTGKLLKPYNNTKGYLQVDLCKNGKEKHYLVHRLIAEAFIPNPNNYPCINHKDENKTNNQVENLEWCDYLYNNNYGSKRQRMSEAQKGNKCYLFGKHHTEETKQKISLSMKGRLILEETKQKLSQARKGKHHTEKTKKKMSLAKKRRKI